MTYRVVAKRAARMRELAHERRARKRELRSKRFWRSFAREAAEISRRICEANELGYFYRALERVERGET